MRSPFARFCQTTGELTGRGPRPAWVLVDGGDKNVLIILAFTFRPGFDEQDQLSARHTVSQLQPMGQQCQATLILTPIGPVLSPTSSMP
jgi:hypothetical protein